MIIFRAVNGVGLGIVQPLLFSLIADKSGASGRGRAFGFLLCTGDLELSGRNGGGHSDIGWKAGKCVYDYMTYSQNFP